MLNWLRGRTGCTIPDFTCSAYLASAIFVGPPDPRIRKVPDGFVSVKQKKIRDSWFSRDLSLSPDISFPHQDSLTRCWRTTAEAAGFDPKPTVYDLRHCWFTNAVRSRVYPHTADATLGHGDKKKTVQKLYLALSDDDLVRAIDMMQFDAGETEIWLKK